MYEKREGKRNRVERIRGFAKREWKIVRGGRKESFSKLKLTSKLIPIFTFEIKKATLIY